MGWEHFWRHFFQNAEKFGFTGRRFQLIALAALGFAALAWGALPWPVLGLFVVAHGFDPVLEGVRAWRAKSEAKRELDVVRKEFTSSTRARRRVLRESEPELPLPSPERETKA